jgi:hypothetical protein
MSGKGTIMALRQTITKTCPSIALFDGVKVESNSISVSDVFYIKVEAVTGTKEKASCSVSFTGEKIKLQKMFEFIPSMGAVNFIAQAYGHLKTLPEFAGATDC